MSKKATKKVTVEKLGNQIARAHGHLRATKITVSDTAEEPRLGDVTDYGYRKNTTGEYVSNAYRYNFGWKNTFYQHAEVEVIIPREMIEQCSDFA